MNERIKELAKLAQLRAEWMTPQGLEWFDNFKEQFAELIVWECMACSTWVGKNNTNTVEPMHTAQAINQRITQQFGVAEREE
jgi:hypothetical protein